MAFPVILVNSATGSDSTASGAGPATALTGTNASTDSNGLVITLDGSPDLSGVLTDGSAVIYIQDPTAGELNFAKITGTNDGADTVTVVDAFAASTSGFTWGIGGKRASIGSTTSKKLFENNAGAGDLQGGWTVEMESGHEETIAAQYTIRGGGSATDGPITLRGAAGAATRPIITASFNGSLFVPIADYYQFIDFDLKNTNATKTASIGIHFSSGVQGGLISGIKIADSTNNFFKGIATGTTTSYGVIQSSEIGHTASYGIDISSAGFLIQDCYVHNTGDHSIYYQSSTPLNNTLRNNIIYNSSSDGIHYGATSTILAKSIDIIANTVDSCTGDGLEVAGTNLSVFTLLQIENNIFSNNGGYGVSFSGAPSLGALNKGAVRVRNNNTFNNTSGSYLNTQSIESGDNTTDPDFENVASGDFTIGTGNLINGGFPQNNIGSNSASGVGSITRTYVDIGAVQIDSAAAAAAGGGSFGFVG